MAQFFDQLAAQIESVPPRRLSFLAYVLWMGWSHGELCDIHRPIGGFAQGSDERICRMVKMALQRGRSERRGEA